VRKMYKELKIFLVIGSKTFRISLKLDESANPNVSSICTILTHLFEQLINNIPDSEIQKALKFETEEVIV
jgi:hypothetical protein